jgi:hypothetical protein
LIAPALDESGQLSGVAMTGTQVEGGAYGARSWQRSSIGLDYRGDYRKTNPARFDGSNQALSLGWQYQPSRRITLFAQETAGTTNRAFGGFSAPAFADQNNFGVPLNEVFDSRVYFSQTSAGVDYRQSARVSVKFTADGFLVRRTSRALIGMQGYRGGVEVSRQMSRSFSTGVAYNYLKFEYPRVYGGSNIHMVAAVFRKSLTRSLVLSANVGVFRALTTGTESFTLSPEVAAVLGRSRGVQAFERAFMAPQVNMALGYTLERSRITVDYTSGVNPGNGTYITSRMDSFRGGFTYSGVRKLSIGASAGYTKTKSIGLTLGDFTTMQGGGGVTYRMARFFSLSLQADRRRFTSPAVVGRSGSAISAGLSFTPGTLPLSIW